MRREDVQLSDGAKLVILRDDYDHYLRLLMPKEGRATFVTPALPLDPFDLQDLSTGDVCRCFAGTMLVFADSQKVTLRLGEYTAWAERKSFSQALNAIAV